MKMLLSGKFEIPSGNCQGNVRVFCFRRGNPDTRQHCLFYDPSEKIQVGDDQEKAQSERNSHSKTRDGKKTKLTIRHL